MPEAIKAGGSVRKGTVLVFTRDQAGNLTARADSHDLITVRRCVQHCNRGSLYLLCLDQ